MKLLPKTALILTLSLFTVLPAFYWLFSQSLLERYQELENVETRRDLLRVLNAVQRDLEALRDIARDWAAWDATYAFVQDRDPAYVEENLTLESLRNIRVDLVAYANAENQPVFVRAYPDGPEAAKQAAAHAQELTAYLSGEGRYLLEHPAPESIHMGPVLLPNCAALLVSLPVLHSDQSGPVGGSLIFARLLHAPQIAELAERVQMQLEVLHLDDEAARTAYGAALGALQSGQRFFIAAESGRQINGFTLLRDLRNRPALLLKLGKSRLIYRQGVELASDFLWSLAFFGLIVLGVILVLLKKAVLARGMRLAGEVQRIARDSDSDSAGQVTLGGHDEMAQLAWEINRMLQALHAEKQKSEALLRNILPAPIAERMKQGETSIAQRFEAVTVLFCDLVDFTRLAERTPPEELVKILNQVFTEFDMLAEEAGLEKIKTIGDAYMLVGGAPEFRADHCAAVARTALRMLDKIEEIRARLRLPLAVRLGMSVGPVVAGVIGRRKFTYDLWGDAVNTAARMESHGLPGKIHCTEDIRRALHAQFTFVARGVLEIKGKGPMRTYFLLGEARPGPAP